MKFAYKYQVSTEEGYDWLTIQKNGIELVRRSGLMSSSQSGYVLELAAGDVITITYSKDGSSMGGDDCVSVLDMMYIYLPIN